jgi:hypothetical protein
MPHILTEAREEAAKNVQPLLRALEERVNKPDFPEFREMQTADIQYDLTHAAVAVARGRSASIAQVLAALITEKAKRADTLIQNILTYSIAAAAQLTEGRLELITFVNWTHGRRWGYESVETIWRNCKILYFNQFQYGLTFV